MNEELFSKWERQLQETAVSFPYPPTPDVAHSVHERLADQRAAPPRYRQLAWAALAILLVLAGLMAVPPVRAALWRLIQAGAITIFVNDPTMTPTPLPTTTPQANITPASSTLATDPIDPLLEMARPITLAEAHEIAVHPLRLPTYPEDLSEPDQVFLQQMDEAGVIIFVWWEEGQANRARLSLYHIETENYAYKGAELIEMTAVNGREAFWVRGPHYFQLQNGRVEPWLFVDGNVLIWWTGSGVTYRLESGLSLEEAVHIAESLQ